MHDDWISYSGHQLVVNKLQTQNCQLMHISLVHKQKMQQQVSPVLHHNNLQVEWFCCVNLCPLNWAAQIEITWTLAFDKAWTPWSAMSCECNGYAAVQQVKKLSCLVLWILNTSKISWNTFSFYRIVTILIHAMQVISWNRSFSCISGFFICLIIVECYVSVRSYQLPQTMT